MRWVFNVDGQVQRLADWEWRLYWKRWRQEVERLHARRTMAGTHGHMYR